MRHYLLKFKHGPVDMSVAIMKLCQKNEDKIHMVVPFDPKDDFLAVRTADVFLLTEAAYILGKFGGEIIGHESQSQ